MKSILIFSYSQNVLCCAVLSGFCCVWLFVTLWTIACQDLLSMGFCRQETRLKEEMWKLEKGFCDNLSFTLAHFLLSSVGGCSACWGWGWSNLASVLVLREQKGNLQGKENFGLGAVWLRSSPPLLKWPRQAMANPSENEAHGLLKVQPIFQLPTQHKLSPWRRQNWTGYNWSFSGKRGRICCLLWFHHLYAEGKGSVSKTSQKENRCQEAEDSVSKEAPAVCQSEPSEGKTAKPGRHCCQQSECHSLVQGTSWSSVPEWPVKASRQIGFSQILANRIPQEKVWRLHEVIKEPGKCLTTSTAAPTTPVFWSSNISVKTLTSSRRQSSPWREH